MRSAPVAGLTHAPAARPTRMPPARPTVLHVSSARSWRGGEQQLAYLLGELGGHGFEQALVCPWGSALAERAAARGWRVAPVARRASIDPLFARGVARVAAAVGADVVHAHDPHAHTAAVLASALLGLRAPVVVHRRVVFPIGRGPFTRWKYDHAAVRRIICISAAVAASLRGAVRAPERLRIVHSGLDLRRFEVRRDGRLRGALGVPDGAPLVGHVAALDRHKGWDVFLEVAARLAAAGHPARFVAVGDGRERASLEARARALGLADRLAFAGFRTDVPEVLAELDLLVFPSESEGLGTTVLDAFAAGVPVVASDVGGLPELVAPGATGLLAPVGDVAAFTAAARRLLDDSALRAEVVAGARRRVLDFDFARTAARTAEVYREVLAGDPA